VGIDRPDSAIEHRRRGPEPRFSRDELARRALELMDAHGTEALTMRRLAEELGIGTMARYRYFPSKTELMDAAIDLERFRRPLQSPGAMRVTDRAIAVLLEAGLSREDAVAAFKALLVHALGSAVFAAAESGPAVPSAAAEHHAALDADEVPAMAAVAGELTAALGGDQAFELGLDALLDGIERRAAR
jgi:AcrR family transcriptional regulator